MVLYCWELKAHFFFQTSIFSSPSRRQSGSEECNTQHGIRLFTCNTLLCMPTCCTVKTLAIQMYCSALGQCIRVDCVALAEVYTVRSYGCSAFGRHTGICRTRFFRESTSDTACALHSRLHWQDLARHCKD